MKKQPFYFLVLMTVAALSFASCKNSADYKKTKSGVMYKIFSESKDSTAKPGNILKLNFTVKVGSSDSVLRTTVGQLPYYFRIEGTNEEYSPTEVFSMLRKGDSAIIVQMVDSLLKKNPGAQMPPFFKKGDKLVTVVKVLNVFTSPDVATKDSQEEIEKEKARQEKEVETDLVKGNQDMAAWLAEKKITAVKTGKGTYVEIKDPGTGLQADSGKFVSVRYEGKHLADGKVFESNMNPQAQPYTFQVGVPSARSPIRGWEEGIRLFKKGGKGTLYIPGPLAYGKNPPGNSPFKANEPLIFDISLVDVSDSQPAAPQHQEIPPQIREQMEKMRQQQQQQPKKPGN